ncbi:hypothetical protein [Paenibacillus endoradicis]|uniref:hypothetical protein n=1 Tax=Paenibacillus endoradicis TaxID=2972487 RepID=UPI002158A2E3|nr:hypothetical protein [Paenibacillus endoradicis]MCR8656955.1 hypothetical protein [Paenibacillus endoradicis]
MIKKMTFSVLSACVILSSVPLANAEASTASIDASSKFSYTSQLGKEVLNIDGITYTVDYNYTEDNTTAVITNTLDNSIEIVSYDLTNSTIYYNGKAMSTNGNDRLNALSTQNFAVKADDDFKSIQTGSEKITWAKGITVAALAVMIAVPIAGLGSPGVIAAMGLSGLATIAGGAIGGTVNWDYQRMIIPFVPPIHRYVWSFTASTGDYYGTYIYQP